MESEPDFTPDPAFLRARREAWFILLAWAVCMAWTVGYAGLFGYDHPAGVNDRVLGWPAWVFWGVTVPWGAATAFSIAFALRGITDETPHGPPFPWR
ncbi:MAG: hypothetical protein SH809_16155 [Rhodothermales bacterium]|nr:hypothetical protein [Rhodothermales bacterium]